MKLPARYRTSSCQHRLCAIARKRLQKERKGTVDAPELKAFYEHALCLVEDVTGDHSERVPPRGQWSRPIVATLVTRYRLNERDLREKTIRLHNLAGDLRSWIDENDLRSEAVNRAMNYIANPLNPPVQSIEGLYYTCVRCVCLDLRRKKNHEQEAAAEMYRRLALRVSGEPEPARKDAPPFPPEETRRALGPFCAAKLTQQLRSRRTQPRAHERVRGFRLGVELLLEQSDQCAEKARLDALCRAAAINARAGVIVVVVPPHTTFHVWLRELRARIGRRAA